MVQLTVATADWSGENTVSVKVRQVGEATTVLLLGLNNQETQNLNFYLQNI